MLIEVAAIAFIFGLWVGVVLTLILTPSPPPKQEPEHDWYAEERRRIPWQ